MPDIYAFYGFSLLDTGDDSYLINSNSTSWIGIEWATQRDDLFERWSFRGLGREWLAGSRPAASNFLLLRQKKVTKEKATRLPESLRFASGNLRCRRKTGVGANSLHCVALKQRAALIPFFCSITGSVRTGQSGKKVRGVRRLGGRQQNAQDRSKANGNGNGDGKNDQGSGNHNSNSNSANVNANAKNTPSQKNHFTTNSIAASAYVSGLKATFNTKAPLLPASASDPACPVLAGPGLAGERRIRAARCLSAASLRGPRLCLVNTGCPQRSAGTQTAGRLFFGDFLLAKQKKVTSRRATPGQQNSAKSTKHKKTPELMAGTKS